MTFIVVLLGLFFTITLANDKRRKDPYNVSEASVGSHPAITVKVTPQSEVGDDLAARMANDLGAMAEFLGIDRLPSVFVSLRVDLDADIIDRGFLGGAEGIVLRTNYTGSDWRYVNFLEHAVGDRPSRSFRRQSCPPGPRPTDAQRPSQDGRLVFCGLLIGFRCIKPRGLDRGPEDTRYGDR